MKKTMPPSMPAMPPAKPAAKPPMSAAQKMKAGRGISNGVKPGKQRTR